MDSNMSLLSLHSEDDSDQAHVEREQKQEQEQEENTSLQTDYLIVLPSTMFDDMPLLTHQFTFWHTSQASLQIQCTVNDTTIESVSDLTVAAGIHFHHWRHPQQPGFCSWKTWVAINEFFAKKPLPQKTGIRFSLDSSVFNLFFLSCYAQNQKAFDPQSPYVLATDNPHRPSLFGIYHMYQDIPPSSVFSLYFSYPMATFVMHQIQKIEEGVMGKRLPWIECEQVHDTHTKWRIHIDEQLFDAPSTFVYDPITHKLTIKSRPRRTEVPSTRLWTLMKGQIKSDGVLHLLSECYYFLVVVCAFVPFWCVEWNGRRHAMSKSSGYIYRHRSFTSSEVEALKPSQGPVLTHLYKIITRACGIHLSNHLALIHDADQQQSEIIPIYRDLTNHQFDTLYSRSQKATLGKRFVWSLIEQFSGILPIVCIDAYVDQIEDTTQQYIHRLSTTIDSKSTVLPVISIQLHQQTITSEWSIHIGYKSEYTEVIQTLFDVFDALLLE